MKKVLIITYYWPPAGGPGVQRWLKFVKYLPDFGIEPIVYIPENPTYPILDKDLEKEVSKDLKVIQQPIFEPYKISSLFSKKQTKTISSGIISEKEKQSFLQKSLLYIRGNYFVPDARILWKKPSVKFLTKFIKDENIETIITTGPPHSLHLIGLELKRKLNIKWLADFRDPWTGMWYFDQLKLTEKTKNKHHVLEKEVLQSADQIITTTQNVKREFENLTSKPIEVITNGYDLAPIEQSINLDKYFIIAHIGSFFSLKNLSGLWEAISEIINENPEFSTFFKLRLMGKNNPELQEELEKYGLLEFTEDLGYLPHKEVLCQQEKSQVLLLQYTNETIKGIIPGKLFEYLRSGRPILAVGPKNWEVKKIIENTKTGKCFHFNEKQQIKHTILEYFQAFQKNELQVQPINIEQYSRKNLTKKLSGLL